MDGTYRMKFGKYGPHDGEPGTKLEDLPVEYLDWLNENLDEDKYNNVILLQEVRNQLALKRGEGVVRPIQKNNIFKVAPRRKA
jgi:uncharacterized protein (DUF3820 family)